MVDEQQNVGGGGQAVAIGIATALTSLIISKLAGKVAGSLVGTPEESEEEMYNRIYGQIENAQIRSPPQYTPAPSRSVARRAPARAPARVLPAALPYTDNSGTMGYVSSALENLAAAKSSTNCGVCQKKIESAIKAVKTESAIIVKSEIKHGIISELKAKGKLPQNAGWNQLTPAQKAFINKKTEELLNHDQR